MNTLDFTDDDIINCIIEVANSVEGEEQNKVIAILIDFMLFRKLKVKDYQK